MAEQKKESQFEELKVEYLTDDGGVKVNGEWYSSLNSYFEKREERMKQEKSGNG